MAFADPRFEIERYQQFMECLHRLQEASRLFEIEVFETLVPESFDKRHPFHPQSN